MQLKIHAFQVLRSHLRKETLMHRTAVMLTITLVVGISVGLLGHQVLIAQQAPVTRTILQQKDLEGVAGREIVMFRAELALGQRWGDTITPGPRCFMFWKAL